MTVKDYIHNNLRVLQLETLDHITITPESAEGERGEVGASQLFLVWQVSELGHQS